jgi:predicted helicase
VGRGLRRGEFPIKTRRLSPALSSTSRNRMDDEQYIVRLIGQVITVSLETMKVVKGLPEVGE